MMTIAFAILEHNNDSALPEDYTVKVVKLCFYFKISKKDVLPDNEPFRNGAFSAQYLDNRQRHEISIQFPVTTML